MSRLSIFDRKPPLSMLTASQLLDLAEELLDMAATTASTPETQRALRRVAALYVVRAALREEDERAATRH